MQLPPPPPPIPEPGSRCRRHCSYGRRHRRCRHHRLRSGPGKDVVAALRASRKRLFSLQSSTVSAARLPGAPTRSPFSGGCRGPSRHRPSPLPAGPAPPREARASLSDGRTGCGRARLGTAGLRTPPGSSSARRRPCLLLSGPEPSLWACQPRSFVAFKNCSVAEGERVPPSRDAPAALPWMSKGLTLADSWGESLSHFALKLFHHRWCGKPCWTRDSLTAGLRFESRNGIVRIVLLTQTRFPVGRGKMRLRIEASHAICRHFTAIISCVCAPNSSIHFCLLVLSFTI